MVKAPVIIGIDPGTTKGFAIVDIGANVIRIDSGKEISLGDMVKKIISYGVPILFTRNEIDTANLLFMIARREQSEGKKPSTI